MHMRLGILGVVALLSCLACATEPDRPDASEHDTGLGHDSDTDGADTGADPDGSDLDDGYDDGFDGGISPHDEGHGLTWVVRNVDAELGVVMVGTDEVSDPYWGDTPCEASLPILCIDDGDPAANPGVEADFYHGWSGGLVLLTSPIAGTELTSLVIADHVCVKQLGSSFRMAEFHHPTEDGGWNWWAFADTELLTPDVGRFWVHIDDQPANCWDWDGD